MPAFMYTGFTETTSPGPLSPDFTIPNCASLNPATLSKQSIKLPTAAPSNILDPCPGAPAAFTISLHTSLSA
uniref:Uncharacterized protein n=1 Tax=Arundo donax TaxID=35708 RepID=A0A0A9DYH5_ARUDO